MLLLLVTTELNSMFKRDGYCQGYPRYLKRGQWRGRTIDFEVLVLVDIITGMDILQDDELGKYGAPSRDWLD